MITSFDNLLDAQNYQLTNPDSDIWQDNGTYRVLTEGNRWPVIPMTATPMQIQLALNQLNMLSNVLDYCKGNPVMQIKFTTAQQFQSNDVDITAWAASIGKTQADIEAIFTLANTF